MKRFKRFLKRHLLSFLLYAVLIYVVLGICLHIGTMVYLERGYHALGGEGFIYAALIFAVTSIIIPDFKKK